MSKHKHHKNVLVDLIMENNVKIFAEIGVARSTTLKHILQRTELSEYWAIDPWSPYKGMRHSKSKWESWHMKACARMLYYPHLRVLRTTSLSASKMFPDGHFDFVYIDADHRYEYVSLDIEFWLPKVKKGGIIGGHDYGSPGESDVKEAVDECFKDVEKLDNFVWIKRI